MRLKARQQGKAAKDAGSLESLGKARRMLGEYQKVKTGGPWLKSGSKTKSAVGDLKLTVFSGKSLFAISIQFQMSLISQN